MKLRKTVVLMLIVACTVFMAACNGMTAESVAVDDVSEENVSVEDITEETLAEEVSLESSVSEEPMVELAAGFDEEFTIKVGETLHVGREDISITLNKAVYDENWGDTFIVYQLKMDETIYEGNGTWLEEFGGSIDQDVFTENRVCYIRADKDESVTLMLTSGTEVKSPFYLSGNAEDEYVTTEPEYVESDDIILFLDENVKVYGNTMELIETIFDLVEKETGLKFKNESEYALQRGSDLEWLYGEEIFAGVDPDKEKFHIYVVPYEKCGACCLTHSIVVNPEDLEIAAGQGMAFVHELVHAVQFANGANMGTTMEEGFATYITGQICDKDEIITFDFNADMNYSYYEVEITAENAEEEYLKVYEDTWNHYLYGYRFVSFLYETYGENIYRNILADATEFVENSGVSVTETDMVPIIKENTSEDVFEKFAEWIDKNKERFEY